MHVIEFLEVDRPFLWNMRAIEGIYVDLEAGGIEDIVLALQNSNAIKLLKLVKIVAYHGLIEGHKKQGTEIAFKSSNDLSSNITNFAQCSKVLGQFTKDFTAFFSVPPELQTEQKKNTAQ